MKTIIHMIYSAISTPTRNLAAVAALILIGTAARTHAQSDTFDGTVLDTDKWIVTSPIIGGSVAQNDALYLTTDGVEPSHFCFAPEAFGGGPGIGMRRKLGGDFDIQVDFRDFDGAYDGATQAFFQIYQDGDFAWRGNQLHIKRIRTQDGDFLQTVASVNGVFPIQTGSPNSATSGTFRIVRIGSQITTYFNGIEDFSLEAFSGPVIVSMHISGPGSGGSIVYDNFLINSGTLVEPPLVCGEPTPTPTPTPTCGQYTISQIGGSIVPGTTDIGNHGDNVVTTIALPFPVQLYDQSFNSINLSSNGNAQLRTTDSDPPNDCLPWTNHDYAIMPYWDDMLTDAQPGCAAFPGGTCGIFTSVTGYPPNRLFNIEWRNAYFSNPSQTGNFELVLYEGQTRFDVIYGTVDQGNSSATAGVQKDDATFDQYFCNGSGGQASGGQSYILQPCGTPTPTPTPTPTATPTPTPTPGQITLQAHGYTVQGLQTVDLFWNGATSANVDIYRNGVLIVTVPNGGGTYTDHIGARGRGTYTYRVCEAGTGNCSNQVTVTFGSGNPTPTPTPTPTATPTPTPTPGQITLQAHGYKIQGLQTVDLFWNGATSANVDIYRDDVLIATVPNQGGSYTDHINRTGRGTYTYRVCQAGSGNCSNQVTVTFGGR